MRRRKHSGGGLDHRQHRLADRLGDVAHQMCRDRARHDDEVGLRPGRSVEVERMPARADTIDPDRHRHGPIVRDRSDRHFARDRFFFRLHRVLEIEHDEIRSGVASLGDRTRVRGGEEEHRPYGEQVGVLVGFRFRSGHGRRIMP